MEMREGSEMDSSDQKAETKRLLNIPTSKKDRFPPMNRGSVLDRMMKNLIEGDQHYDVEFKIRTADTGEIKAIHSIATFDKERGIIFGSK